ncbi:MAG: DUF805 domain-containing protein [Pseudomonadota bacterium]
MDWMLMPLRRYADFSGRSQRKEFWMFQLLNLIVIAIFMTIMFSGMPWAEMAAQNNQYGKFAAESATAQPAPGPLFFVGLLILMLWILGTFIPMLAVTVRRLHDQDKSGWWWLLNFVPFGAYVLIAFFCIEGTKGPNQYGPDPMGRGPSDIFA